MAKEQFEENDVKIADSLNAPDGAFFMDGFSSGERDRVRKIMSTEKCTARRAFMDVLNTLKASRREGWKYLDDHYERGQDTWKSLLDKTKIKFPKSEAKSERTLRTFPAWKRAAKQIDANVWFDGDRDICQALVGPNPFKKGETKSIGEWDGEEGVLYQTTISEAKMTKDQKRAKLRELQALLKAKVADNKSKHGWGYAAVTKHPDVRTENELRKKIADLKDSILLDESFAFVEVGSNLFDVMSPTGEVVLSSVSELIAESYVKSANRRLGLTEDESLQSIGKQLKNKSSPKADQETSKETEKVEEPKADQESEPGEKITSAGDEQEKPAEYKVGDVVKPLKGPHEGELHDVVKVFPDGSLGIKPKNLDDSAVKYQKGQAKIRPDNVVLAEGLKYEDPKKFGRKLFNKVMGIPSGPYKYKVGDTVKYEMSPAQEGGSGTGKIEKLLDGHHYLVNGKPVNQNEIKAKISESLLLVVSEAVAAPFKKFKKGQIVKVKKTGKTVEVVSQDEIGLVYTATPIASKVDPKKKTVYAIGYKDYMPSELEE